MTGHPAGLALDYMTTSSAQGWAIAAHLLANAEGYGVEYVIFERTYMTPGGKREPMADRGSPTQNHMDHVHANFRLTPGTKAVDKASGYVAGPETTSASPLAVFDGWQTDATGLAVKLAVTAAALGLVVLGAIRSVSPGKQV
jgi:hypothetical protein